MPQQNAPHFSWSDKANHVFAFVVLGMLLRLSYRISYWRAIIYLLMFGSFIELSQYITPTRSAEIQDIGADLMGVFVGLKLFKYLRKALR
jgi:VanZ family protein